MDNYKNSGEWPVREGITITKDGGIWTWVAGSAGPSERWPEQDFCLALAWLVQQLHLGIFEVQEVEDGEVISVLIGRGASLAFEDEPSEEVINSVNSRVEKRTLSVQLAGVFAQGREKGIEPKHEKLAEAASEAINARSGASFNTELHYAFQLIGILQRIRKRSLDLDSPPILGNAPLRVVDLLGEATQCYLYGFHQACVAICRACLENSLKKKVPKSELRQELQQQGLGELKCLVSAAFRLRLLDDSHRERANMVREYGNAVLHSKQNPGEGSWDVLQHTRGVVAYLFRNADGGSR